MTTRRLRPEEARAWARVAKHVRPLEGKPSADAAPDAPSKDKSEVKTKRAVQPATPVGSKVNRQPTSCGDVADRSGEKRVRRGRLPIAATLDLHGHTQISAQAALLQFLDWHRTDRTVCVLIITGKGRDGSGILKRRFMQWIESAEARGLVSGYSQAHRRHGGGGAWYVFIRKS